MRDTKQAVMAISRAGDPKAEMLRLLGGKIDAVKPLGSLVLIAQYVRPEKTAGGIILTQTSKDEDIYQGKVGLIVAMGPAAFKYSGVGQHYEFEGDKPQIGDWVEFGHYDGKQTSVNGVFCRWLESYLIRSVVSDPEIIY